MHYRRRGVVLFLVLIVVTMLALGSLGFAELMLNEHRAAQTASRQSQARAFAESGAEVARQFLDRIPDDQQTAGGLYDNAQRFSNQIVADDNSPRDQGRFTIVAPKIDDTAVTGTRYGLQDESARINLATILNLRQSSGSASSDGDDSHGQHQRPCDAHGPAGHDRRHGRCHSRLDRRRRHAPRAGRGERLLQQPRPRLYAPQRPARYHRRALAGARA